MSMEAKLYIHDQGETNWVSYDFIYFEELYEMVSKKTGIDNPIKYSVHIDDIEIEVDDIISFFNLTEDKYFDNEDYYWNQYRKKHLFGDIFDADTVYNCIKEVINFFKNDSAKEYVIDNQPFTRSYILEDLESLLKDILIAKKTNSKLRIEIG